MKSYILTAFLLVSATACSSFGQVGSITRLDDNDITLDSHTNAITTTFFPMFEQEDPDQDSASNPVVVMEITSSNIASAFSSATAQCDAWGWNNIFPNETFTGVGLAMANAKHDLEATGYFPESGTAQSSSVIASTSSYEVEDIPGAGDIFYTIAGEFILMAIPGTAETLSVQTPFIDEPMIQVKCGASFVDVYHVGGKDFFIYGELRNDVEIVGGHALGVPTTLFLMSHGGLDVSFPFKQAAVDGTTFDVEVIVNSDASLTRGGPDLMGPNGPISNDGEAADSWDIGGSVAFASANLR